MAARRHVVMLLLALCLLCAVGGRVRGQADVFGAESGAEGSDAMLDEQVRRRKISTTRALATRQKRTQQPPHTPPWRLPF
jgi:hypothetical protein